MKILLFLFFALSAYGQVKTSGGLIPPSYTVATLPSAPPTGTIAIVTDAATAGSCTSGSGSALSICRYSGAAWVAVGDGGSGSGTPGGSTTQVQYNNAGAFAGSSLFTFDSGTGVVSVAGVSLTGAGAGSIKVYDPTGTYYREFQGPSSPSANVTFKECDAAPSGGQVKQWSTPSAGVSTCTWVSAGSGSMDYASAATWTANGAASIPAAKWTGTPFSGTGTTAKALVLIEPTGTTAGTSWLATGTALGINVPNGGGISPLDIKLDGSSVVSVSQYGAVTVAGNLTAGSSVITQKFGVDYSSAASVSGCSAGTISTGSTAGTFVSGSTAACTFVITMGASQSSAVGWNCWMNNQTTAYTAFAQVPRQTASSTTTATFSATTTSGDVMNWGCISR